MKNPDENGIYTLETPARLDAAALSKNLTTGKTSPRYQRMLEELAEAALKTARPAGIYKVSHILKNNGKKIDIDGVTFTSVVLGKLLEGQDTVIPFIVTGGKELMEMIPPHGEMMQQFYLDTIKTMIVAGAVNYLKEYVQKEHLLTKAALMNPGEIEDWYIVEQRPLFSLFGDVEERIGVTLTEGGVMHPIKSRSGIMFPNDTGFESCQLCLQARCPGRRCKFEPAIYEHYLGKPAKAGK